MSDLKERLSVSIDANLAAQARQAVAEGFADSISSWVAAAMRQQIEHDNRLRALDVYLSQYEAEHGEITVEEMDAARRKLASRAIIVRTP